MPTIGVCTSAMQTNIQSLLTRLEEARVANIKFVPLPYNDVGSYRLNSRTMDGIILCHSIHNRRFAITDVTDSLYDAFLDNARRVFGKDKVVVIGHDFKWPCGDGESEEEHARVKETLMASFRIKQPTTFQCSELALVCGRLDGTVQMDEDDWQRLMKFVINVKPRSRPDPLPDNGKQAADCRAILFSSLLSLILFVLMVTLLATEWLDTGGKVSVTIVIIVILTPQGAWTIKHVQVIYTKGRREQTGDEYYWYMCKWWLATPFFWRYVAITLYINVKALSNSDSPENTSLPFRRM